ncbi:MAG TPA: hypothetical protein VMR28_01600 [Candidatus Saccharimonadales bacterium]|nr:hypothetical protein [Candidatus Saccharimonadales bacterium]
MTKLRQTQMGFTVIESLLVLLVIVIIVAAGFLVANHIDKTKKPATTSQTTSIKKNSPAVMAVYAQTADKMASVVTAEVTGATLYSKQSLPVEASSASNETNEVKKLYCFTVVNSPSLTEQVIDGFNNDSSATWTDYMATSGTGSQLNPYSYSATSTNPSPAAFADTLEPLITQTGQVNISFSTSNTANKPITTNNPNYWPSGKADADISIPTQTNQCITIAKQNNVNTSNKLILSVTLDFYDSNNSSTF